MSDESRRRYDDSTMIKVIKDFWPVVVAVISLGFGYGKLDSRLTNVELSIQANTPTLADSVNRITRLETIVLNMQGDIKDIKSDVRTLVSRSKDSFDVRTLHR